MRLGGVTELAYELSISRQALAKLREREDFPVPIATIAVGPIWDLDTVKRWASSGARRGPGRPDRQSVRLRLGDRFALESSAIGSGGFGKVYRAIDLKSSDVVAIKILRDDAEQETRRRFARELSVLERLQHPNVVPILASGEDSDENPWFAMPLALGSLADQLPDFANNVGKILDVIRQICAGIAYVHQEGIFHRDLKPENVLQIRTGVWAVADFGLARDTQRLTTTLTESSAGFGTELYVAPEQRQSAKYAAIPADIYSLGKVLQALAIGDLPFPGVLPSGVLRPIIVRATRHEPEQRYSSAGSFLEDLERAVATSRIVWENPPMTIERLKERIKEELPDDGVLKEFVEIALAINNETSLTSELIHLIPLLSRGGIARLWETDTDSLRIIVERYVQAMLKERKIPFPFCDNIADFLKLIIDLTDDDDILRQVTAGLTGLGYSHGRWHVRDVLIDILQHVRTTDSALMALEGLQEAGNDAVGWSLDGFAARSLHPILREGVATILR